MDSQVHRALKSISYIRNLRHENWQMYNLGDRRSKFPMNPSSFRHLLLPGTPVLGLKTSTFFENSILEAVPQYYSYSLRIAI